MGYHSQNRGQLPTIAFELGKKGTTEDDLVKNNYTKISLYLNFYDYWFFKRKFD